MPDRRRKEGEGLKDGGKKNMVDNSDRPQATNINHIA